jgi:hypothetical protein
MESNKNIHQYEPLRVPKNWGTEERKVLLQLTDILDDIYRRYGRLRLEDLASSLRTEITDATGNIATLTQSADGLLSRVENIEGSYSTIEQTAIEISFAVSSALSGFNNLIAGTSYGYANLVYAAQTYRDIKAKAAITGYSIAALDTIAVRTYIDNPSGESVRLLVKEYSAADVLLASNYGDYVTTATDGYSGVTFTLDADTTQISIGIESAGAITETLRYKQLKMEMGAAFSGWTPHPTDPAAGVKTSYITIDNDSIDIASGGTLNLSAAGSIKIGTSPLSVGGTNLIPNSYFDITSGLYGFATTTISGLKNSTEYTLSFRGNVATLGTGTSIRCYIYADDWTYSVYAETQSTTETTATLTFTTPSNIEGKTIKFGAVSNPSGNGGTVYLRWAKLEKGNIATDWSPAPEDPASGVKTSYINIDNDSINIASGGSFTVESENFSINSSNQVYIKGTLMKLDPENGYLEIGVLDIRGGNGSSTSSYLAHDSAAGYLYLENTYGQIAIYGNDTSTIFSDPTIVAPTVSFSSNVYVYNDVSADTFTDHTSDYDGDALDELKKVKGKNGSIDHSTLPKSAQKKVKRRKKVNDEEVEYEEDGRDLGMMISILTKAVQELMAVNDEQNSRIKKLEETVTILQKQIDTIKGV